MKERNTQIDFLRFLGLSLIILAHVQAPFFITQIRCFDVPLMLFISGLTFSGKHIDSFGKYVLKRFARLLIPVWLFLTLYLGVFYVFQSYLFPKPYLTPRMIARSFLLLDESIGYVWIIRVFLIIALLSPMLVVVSNMLKNRLSVLAYVVFMVLFVHVIYLWTNKIENEFLLYFVKDIILYGLAYSIPFICGIKFIHLSEKESISLSLFFVFLFVVMLVYYAQTKVFPIGLSSVYKYPPRAYYIIYGVMMSTLLWTSRFLWINLSIPYPFVWIGRNTIWIYLWHMPFALMTNVLPLNWCFKYIIVYLGALVIFVIQYFIIKKINNQFLTKYLIG